MDNNLTEPLDEYGGPPIDQIDDSEYTQGGQYVGPDSPGDDTNILDPADPVPSARRFIAQYYAGDTNPLLHHFNGEFFAYNGVHYKAIPEPRIRAAIYAFAEAAKVVKIVKKQEVIEPFCPTKTKIENIMDALRAVAHLSEETPDPSWFVAPPPDLADIAPGDLLPMSNGLLDLDTLTLHPLTPALWNTANIGIAYQPQAPAPVRWLKFMDEIWPNDPHSIATLQDWFGYCLSRLTRLQKMLLLVGAKRSGKGTIIRILKALIGAHNVINPSLESMGKEFGLSEFIGKTLAIFPDIRQSAKADQAAFVERLLSISGEDDISVPRKYLLPWNGRLKTRFMLLSNPIPTLHDPSGALASRFIMLICKESFIGREDETLTDTLMTELPGILNWAIDGHTRLTGNRRFIQPESSTAALEQLEELGSPVTAFVRDCCIIKPGATCEKATLFEAWKLWCKREGRDHTGNASSLGRDLTSAYPHIGISRPRQNGQRIQSYEGIKLTDTWRYDLNSEPEAGGF